MTVLHCQAYLSKQVESLVLSEILKDPSLLLLLVFVLDLGLQVSVISIVHDDTQLALLCLIDLAEANNVGMAQHLQDLSLPKCLFSFLVAQLLDINLLDNGILSIRLALDEVCGTEGSSAEGGNLFVGLILFLFNHSSLLLS